MSRFEKIAWFNLAVSAVSVLLQLALFFSVRTSHPLNISLKISFAAFALLGFTGLGPSLFKKRSKPDSTIIDRRDGSETMLYDSENDERDRQIQRKAQLHGFSAFWIIVVFLTMIAWVYLQYISPVGTGTGPMSITIVVDFLPLMLFPAAAILIIAISLSTIIQYRSNTFGENSFESGIGPTRKNIVYTLAFSLFFIAFSIFMVSYMDWMFAVNFLMIIFASTHLSIRSLRNNPSGNYCAGDIRVLKIAEWTACLLFIVFYLTSIGSIVMLYLESVTFLIIVVRLFMLGFGTLIFLLSILKYGNEQHIERRYEKT